MKPSSHYTIFNKNGYLFGISIDHVREVIHGAILIPAPVASSGFLGFFDFRQKLCPVFDIQTMLDHAPAPQEIVPRNLIVVECDRAVFALWIDHYVESVQVGDAEMDAPPEIGDQPFVDKVFWYKGKSLTMIKYTLKLKICNILQLSL